MLLFSCRNSLVNFNRSENKVAWSSRLIRRGFSCTYLLQGFYQTSPT